jgi:hypothetical protein
LTLEAVNSSHFDLELTVEALSMKTVVVDFLMRRIDFLGKCLSPVLIALFLLCSALLSSCCLCAQMPTEDRLLLRGWWPRHSSPSREEYLGPAECLRCHKGKAAAQDSTAMGHTASHVTDSQVLSQHARLTLQDGRYTFQINTEAGKSVYLINDGTNSISKLLVWAFGDGHIGQSYLFEQNGTLYESRVSYFDKLGTLDFTPGRKLSDQKDLESAMARPVTGAELVRCFGCHTTASNIKERFAGDKAIPGITCEACHGPGLQHGVAQEVENLPQSAGKEGQADLIFDPGKLAPADAVDFCGACHGTWWDVKLAALTGLANLRAQPYRLEKSRCWGKKGDARLTCVACHDPHRPLVHDLASYDKNCLNCHAADSAAKSTPDHPGSACKVATKNCVSCHMPTYEEPSMHYAFRDHFIRVVQPDAPYPD